jgi:hypothetical protein
MTTNFTDLQDVYLEMERRLQDDVDFCRLMMGKMPTFQGEALRLIQHLDQDLRRLKFLTANQTNIAASVSSTKNPLVHQVIGNPEKNIMGKKVGESRKPITPQALAPTKNKQAEFEAKVGDLYAGFAGLSNQDVANIISKPQGETVLRGVAKRAGVSDYASRDSSELNFGFFDLVREAIAEKESAQLLLDTVDAGIEAEDVEVIEEVAPAKKSRKASASDDSNPIVAAKNKSSMLD